MSDTIKRALAASMTMRRAAAGGGRMNEVNSYLDSYHVEDTPEARQRLKDLSKQNYYDGTQSMSPEQRYQLDRLTRSYNVAPEIGGLNGPLQSWDDWAAERMNRLQHGFGENLATGNFASGGKVQRILDSLGFYSHGREVAAKAPQKMSPEAFENYMTGSNRGVKKSELEHADWRGQTKGIKTLTPSDAADLLQSSAPKITEIVRNNDGLSPSTTPKYEDYTLGGHDATNYTERLLTVPTPSGADPYTGGHWNEPNVIAHMRTHDRLRGDDLPLFGQTPSKMLHIEEIQSDWGQQGRQSGFSATPEEIAAYHAKVDPLRARLNDLDLTRQDVHTRLRQEAGIPAYDVVNASHRGDINAWRRAMDDWRRDVADHVEAHPDYRAVTEEQGAIRRELAATKHINEDGPWPGPYVTDTKDWTDLAIKRALRVAAEGGYHRVGISGSDVQDARWGDYNLSGFYDKIESDLQKKIRSVDPKAGGRHFEGIGEQWRVHENGSPMDDDYVHSDQRSAEREADRLQSQAYENHEEYLQNHDPSYHPDENGEWPERDYDGEYYEAEREHKAEIPSYDLSNEAREKINREGFPYFADGGAVDENDAPMFSVLRAPESITGRSPYGQGHPERTIGNYDDPLIDEYASTPPEYTRESSRYAGDKLLGAGSRASKRRNLPVGRPERARTRGERRPEPRKLLQTAGRSGP
jgi:hypothetical protein